MHRVGRGLPRLFTTNPKTPYELESVPNLPFEFGGAAIARGSLRVGRPGRVRVKTPVENACSFVHVMLHEGVPGHLFQMHTADESASVSAFRRDWGGVLAYVEGWAEYASDLSDDLGLGHQDFVRTERIVGKVFMAARAAVDTGIHWHGWSAERGAAFYRESAPWAPQAVVEGVVQRALANAGMQSAYMIGQQKMLALRTEATRDLGPRFNIKSFHDQVLQNGALPLGVLEQHIHDWVANEKRRPE